MSGNTDALFKKDMKNVSKSSSTKDETPKSISLSETKPSKQRTSSSMKKSIFRKKVATRKIGKFVNKTAKFLKLICANSGECVSFGKKMDEITAFFNGYTHFDFVVGSIRPIGVASKNGFVKEIQYNKDGYDSYAILKSSMRKDSDNLVYEYIVGTQFINHNLRKFPCFVQTYSHYFYKEDRYWNNMLQNAELKTKALVNGLELQPSINWEKACSQSKYAAILIQHIHSAETLNSHITDSNITPFAQNDLLYVLFIIYHALSKLSANFTHYDLHSSNVLLYEPYKGKYIQYYYHLIDGTTIEFRCPFIPKIIDYGRSFFDNGSTSSQKIYDKMILTRECQPGNGIDMGFQWFQPSDKYFIISQKKNASHDLRLLVTIKYQLDKYTGPPPTNAYKEISELLTTVQYGVGINTKFDYYDIQRNLDIIIKKYKERFSVEEITLNMKKITTKAKDQASIEALNRKNYGTKEDMNLYRSGRIVNVIGAYLRLKSSVLKPTVKTENYSIYSDESMKFADFHIYEDGRPMEFFPMK